MSVTANTTYTASFPKRPKITGAPDQVFQFNNFLERLIGGIKANTISAIRTINPGSLCTQYLYAPQIHFNLAGKPIAFIGNTSNKMGEFSLIKIDVTSNRLFPYIKVRPLWTSVSTMEMTCPRNCCPKLSGTISKNPSLVL